ncbi:MAG TPA: bifunctional diguanylate cyclase/phosphodiesterase, partial [Xanthobacteraceae bacterium]|nr:bifunctional diguanylate cyclase/phosphodiesterase [Xanthobacteraceae bacterium]
MGLGPDEKYLEKSGYLTPAIPAPSLALPDALKIASRLIPPLSIGLLVALVVGGLGFLGHARVADDRESAHHHNAIRSGIEQLRVVQNAALVDAQVLRSLQDLSGVRKLRWETEPDHRGREVQSVQDANGRIVGWLTWESERSTTSAAMRFMPLWAIVAAGLLLLAVLSMWYVRQLTRELEAANERTRRTASEDPISGLPGASAILETLEHTLAQREADEFVTLCYLDLTGFRELSDAFGRPWSNELVRAAADRLRELDWPDAALGRLGRHRFLLILRSKDPDAGMRMARDADKLIAKPMTVQGQIVHIRSNIGLAYAPRDGVTSDDLFRHATLAMRAAKRAGRGSIMPFESSMEADLHERRFLERELKRALDEDALELHYQPIISAEGSQIIGVEALLRWLHPTRGNIPPKVFVPVAEHTGMMSRLGEYVLYRALNDAKRWPHLYIAVNLSPIQVKDRALFTLVSSMLEETGVDGSRLVLEITEGMLIDDAEETRKRLEEIRELGVRIALDDFGSGYSSLSYLQSFPIDKLKIDGSFVAPLGKSENSGFIIQAIVALGRALNLSVLVEGVETEEQRVLLRLAGCDEMQGFLFARPGPRQTIDALLLEAKLQAARG